jgi:hypothetical protein
MEKPATKSLMSGTWASTLLPAEEGDLRRYTLAERHGGEVGSRLDPQHVHAAATEILQQVAVVARDLDDPGLATQPETADHHRGILFGMAQPGLGIRAEVDIVAEDRLRALELVELHQPAVAANVGVQRIEGLTCSRLVRCDEGVGERRHAEIGEGLAQRCLTEPAGTLFHYPRPIAS